MLFCTIVSLDCSLVNVIRIPLRYMLITNRSGKATAGSGGLNPGEPQRSAAAKRLFAKRKVLTLASTHRLPPTATEAGDLQLVKLSFLCCTLSIQFLLHGLITPEAEHMQLARRVGQAGGGN